MSNKARSRQKRTDTTDARADHIPLGTDDRGAVHSAHTHAATDQIIVAYPDRTVRRKEPPAGDRVDIEAYVEDVGREFGWADRQYGRNLIAEVFR